MHHACRLAKQRLAALLLLAQLAASAAQPSAAGGLRKAAAAAAVPVQVVLSPQLDACNLSGSVVVWTMLDVHYVPLVTVWYSRVSRLLAGTPGGADVVVVALDTAASSALHAAPGSRRAALCVVDFSAAVAVASHSGAGDLAASAGQSGDGGNRRLAQQPLAQSPPVRVLPPFVGLAKFAVTAELLARGAESLFSEMDVFWYANPLADVRARVDAARGVELAGQQWEHGRVVNGSSLSLNIGFFFARPAAAPLFAEAAALWADTPREAADKVASDQKFLNVILDRKHVVPLLLPRHAYAVAFCNHSSVMEVAQQGPLVVHFTCLNHTRKWDGLNAAYGAAGLPPAAFLDVLQAFYTSVGVSLRVVRDPAFAM